MNPTWGAPRIVSELALLGHDVAQQTVAKYMVRTRKPPSQTWRTFLHNHVPDIAACDFFTVPTATFRVLYVFLVPRHDRRKVVHLKVTTNPYAEWTAQQIVNAYPDEEAPRFLLRDRDGIYGQYFQDRMKGLGIEEVLIAPRAPWQNPYCERIIGSIRRECLDHVIILNEAHLKRMLTDYFEYYHLARCTPVSGSQLTDATRSRTTAAGQSHFYSASRWPASSILASCVIVKLRSSSLVCRYRSVRGGSVFGKRTSANLGTQELWQRSTSIGRWRRHVSECSRCKAGWIQVATRAKNQ